MASVGMGENAVHCLMSPSSVANALTLSTAPAKSGGESARQGSGQRGLGASMNSSRRRAAHGVLTRDAVALGAKDHMARFRERSSLHHGPSSLE